MSSRKKPSWPGKSAKRVFALDVRPSTSSFSLKVKTWMPGTGPGMTNEISTRI